jgi:hydroxymethylbilane synthase
MVAALDDEPTRFEVGLERAFQKGVGGGCSVPLGINARLSGERVLLRAVFGDDDAIIFKEQIEGLRDDAESLVDRLLEGLKTARAGRG